MANGVLKVKLGGVWQPVTTGVVAGGAAGPHHATHEDGGNDEVALDASQIVSGTIASARLPATTPTAHQSTHQIGGSDVLVNNAWTNQANTFTANQTVNGHITAVNGDVNARDFGGRTAYLNESVRVGSGAPYLDLNENPQPVNARRWLAQAYAQVLKIVACNDDSANQRGMHLDRYGNVRADSAFYERGRASAVGGLIPFTPVPGPNTGISVVGNANYSLVGNMLTMGMYLSDTYCTVAQNSLYYNLPGGYIAAGNSTGAALMMIGGTWEIGVAVVQINTTVAIHRQALANFPAMTTLAVHMSIPIFVN